MVGPIAAIRSAGLADVTGPSFSTYRVNPKPTIWLAASDARYRPPHRIRLAAVRADSDRGNRET